MNIYISDLDGTLLNNNGALSEYTISILNKLNENNINFSVATARTPATVVPILSEVNINLPIIVMNGAAIYDLKSNKYITYNSIPKTTTYKILDVLKNNNISGFCYTIDDNHIFAYYDKISNICQANFMNSRLGSPLKTFINGPIPKDSNIIHFFLMDNKETIMNVYEKIKHIDGLYLIAYEDVYNKEVYTLEIYNEKSSKANAIKYLMNEFKFNSLTCFGDNLNDIPMFELADECFAVDNATDELKSISTSIIESNMNNGVAKYLESLYKKESL
ncbi:HAD family hydrolase [Clostridium baratii]|uniref:HAD family hydrolase n=1 Tax=Clostridium baratii TaxID=1561 RepID=UPI001CAE438B|nr:HAD family hydrolase [Clostridium baratii]STB01105.1 HAD-superfamily hydrolase [Clostridium baratii]